MYSQMQARYPHATHPTHPTQRTPPRTHSQQSQQSQSSQSRQSPRSRSNTPVSFAPWSCCSLCLSCCVPQASRPLRSGSQGWERIFHVDQARGGLVSEFFWHSGTKSFAVQAPSGERVLRERRDDGSAAAFAQKLETVRQRACGSLNAKSTWWAYTEPGGRRAYYVCEATLAVRRTVPAEGVKGSCEDPDFAAHCQQKRRCVRSVEEPADKRRRCLPSSAQSTQRNQPRQTLAVVDTNVLLQQLNLLGSFASAAPGASCPVVLVIPQVVRTELTGLSHSDDSERRAAALAAIAWLEQRRAAPWLRSQQPHEAAVLRERSPGRCPDDSILSCCIFFAASGSRTALVSHDSVLAIKAKAHGIQCLGLQDLHKPPAAQTRSPVSRTPQAPLLAVVDTPTLLRDSELVSLSTLAAQNALAIVVPWATLAALDASKTGKDDEGIAVRRAVAFLRANQGSGWLRVQRTDEVPQSASGRGAQHTRGILGCCRFWRETAPHKQIALLTTEPRLAEAAAGQGVATCTAAALASEGLASLGAAASRSR